MVDHSNYRPTKKVAEHLRLLLRANVPDYRIAEVLGTAETILRRHYPLVFAESIRRSGVKPHEPTDESRSKIRALAAVGVSRENIGFVMGISPESLTRHYRDDLRDAQIEANSKVSAKMLSMALGPNDAKNTFLAAKWWEMTRMGLSEKLRSELSGPDGKAIQTEQQIVVILPDNGRGSDIDADAPDAELVEDRLLPAPEDADNE